MYSGKSIFSQIMEFVSRYEFNKCVKRYQGTYRTRQLSFWDQFLSMAFAQLTGRESLRDIESCLGAVHASLYHLGFRAKKISRSTLADANNCRDWRIFADFAQILIGSARALYANDKHDNSIANELENATYALDATVIEVSLSLFPWALYGKDEGFLKVHTLLDLQCKIPTFTALTARKVYETKILNYLTLESGATYVMDRGYLDYNMLFRFTESFAFFVIRAKKKLLFKRLYSNKIDKSTGVRSDQIIRLIGQRSQKKYPLKLRRIRYFDRENDRYFTFLTNNFLLPANTIAHIYHLRWHIELFFKWMKQHLRIKAFYGNSENAVKTQIWIAVSVYVLVSIIKKKLGLNHSLYTILQILGLTLFEKMPIYQAFSTPLPHSLEDNFDNQLKLFDIPTGQ